MSDPISERMTQEQRARWELLRAQGYAALAEAHAIYLAAAKRSKP